MSRTAFYCRCGARLVGSERVNHVCPSTRLDAVGELRTAVEHWHAEVEPKAIPFDHLHPATGAFIGPLAEHCGGGCAEVPEADCPVHDVKPGVPQGSAPIERSHKEERPTPCPTQECLALPTMDLAFYGRGESAKLYVERAAVLRLLARLEAQLHSAEADRQALTDGSVYQQGGGGWCIDVWRDGTWHNIGFTTAAEALDAFRTASVEGR